MRKILMTAAGLLLATTLVSGQQPAAKPTKENTSVKDVMKQAHKKPNELLKRVALGKASQKESQRLLELYKVLAEHSPPKGDQASWDEKTKLLVDAVADVVAGQPEGQRELAKASNCKSCHTVHK